MRGVLLRFEGDLLRYARRIVGDEEHARDVVQETFLKLWRKDRAELDGHLVEWLYTVCRNQAVDVRRKEQRMQLLAEESLAVQESADPSPGTLAERHDSAARILDLVDRLPANQQEVIRLKFQSGLELPRNQPRDGAYRLARGRLDPYGAEKHSHQIESRDRVRLGPQETVNNDVFSRPACGARFGAGGCTNARASPVAKH